MPMIIKHMEDKHCIDVHDEEDSILLSTIKFPKEMKYLKEILPDPNYSILKVILYIIYIS